MDHCQFHPREAATFNCSHCEIFVCDKCADDEHGLANANCFLCSRPLESIGAGGTVEPFWRRLQESFRYPLSSDGMFIVVAATLAPLLASGLPIWSIIIFLFFNGALLKYCFTCLMCTAMGNFKPPHVREAYDGSFQILFSLILLTAVVSTVVIGAYIYLGVATGSILGALALILMPAMLIRFAQSESVVDALNPILALRIVTTIGLPYGLLLAFIIIMMSSVGVLHSFFDYFLPKGAGLIQSIVSNYYAVVIFHLIGYMLFQFQRELGYSARLDNDSNESRSPIDRRLAKIEVLIKSGEYEQAIECFEQGIKEQPLELRLWDEYMEFLYAVKKPNFIRDLADRLIDTFIQTRRQEKLLNHFKRIRLFVPDYMPAKPDARLKIAVLLKEQGDLKTALLLLNGLHKSHPHFPKLVLAYELMASLLDQQPQYHTQAQKCRELIEQLRLREQKSQEEKAVQVQHIKQDIAKAFPLPSKHLSSNPNAIQAAPQVKETPSWDLVPIEKPTEQPE